MKLIPIEKKDVEIISEMKSRYFKELNYSLGFDKYKVDPDIMTKNIEKRMTEPYSPYKYLAIQSSEGTFAGYVHILYTKNLGEILMIQILDNFKSQETMDSVVQMVISSFKKAGIPRVYSELAASDNLLRNSMHKLGAEAVIHSVRLDI